MAPYLGLVVLYRLTALDAERINRRRPPFRTRLLEQDGWPQHAQAHVGNPVVEGDDFPAIVVQCLLEKGEIYVNLQVLLNGNDSLWVLERIEGVQPGQWRPVEAS